MKQGQINKEKVITFLKALEEGNAKTVANLFAVNGVHLNPYSSGLFNDKVEGRDEIEKYWQGPIENFESMEFPVDEIYAMEDESIVFIKFTGNVTLKDNAGLYSNDYYATFKFNSNNEIVEYVEIFNPIVAARGFGLLDQIK